MTERPILFSGPMVRAILDGRKTQTRRIIKPQPPVDEIGRPEYGKILGPEMFEPVAYDRHGEMIPGPEIFGAFDENGEWGVKCPYGQPSDRLWVRETWFSPPKPHNGLWGWRADGDHPHGRAYRIRPSIHMPRKYCRLVLEVVEVRVERLQDISRGDCMDEGCPFPNMAKGPDPRQWFADLWDTINAKRGYGWDSNPWVWVIEFTRVQGEHEHEG